MSDDLNKISRDIESIKTTDKTTYDSFADFIKNNSQLFIIMGVFGSVSLLINNFIKDNSYQNMGIILSLAIFLLLAWTIFCESLKIDEIVKDIPISRNFIEKYLFISVFVTMTMILVIYMGSNIVLNDVLLYLCNFCDHHIFNDR